MQLYLDCDGVLADFDRGATELLGMPPRAFQRRRGAGAFWRELARHPDFYGTLPLLPDAMILFEAVRHLDPVILTGLPLGKWAAPQKVSWAAEHFPGTKMLTVMAVDSETTRSRAITATTLRSTSAKAMSTIKQRWAPTMAAWSATWSRPSRAWRAKSPTSSTR